MLWFLDINRINMDFSLECQMGSFKYLIPNVAFINLLIMVLSFQPVSAEQELNLLRIGTGGKTGVYYPIGRLIAKGISSQEILVNKAGTEQRCLSIAQNSGGSIDNVKGICAGELEAGLVQADIASMAFEGRGVFKNEMQARDLRAVASLYPEKFQIVVRRDSGIKTLNDIRGKRISVDEPGSGTLAVMKIVLDVHGLSEKDFHPVYLKPVFTHDRIVSGELNGFVMMGGVPMEAVTRLLDQEISLVPVQHLAAVNIHAKHPYLVPGKVADSIYPGISETPTIEVYALLTVKKSMDEDLVYRITQALWQEDTLSLLKNGHPQGASISPDTALAGISIPLHPGAEQYYREHRDRFPDLK